MMKDMKKYIQTNMDHFQELSLSTNKVLQFSYKGKAYILKKQMLPDDRLSPFWQMMKDVFDSGFQKQRAFMKSICQVLEENPHIQVANFVLADEEEGIQVFERMPGYSWEPDVFPNGAGIACQLGRFIGFNHSRCYDGYELPGMGNSNLKEKIIRHMKDTIALHWNGDDALDVSVRSCYKRMKSMDVACNDLSLIMADISANQFLFHDEEISACVDLDAYVIGPKAWELALIQNCVTDMESFKRGYEQYQKFPDTKKTSGFYMFLMALNDVGGKEEMHSFLKKDGLLS